MYLHPVRRLSLVGCMHMQAFYSSDTYLFISPVRVNAILHSPTAVMKDLPGLCSLHTKGDNSGIFQPFFTVLASPPNGRAGFEIQPHSRAATTTRLSESSTLSKV